MSRRRLALAGAVLAAAAGTFLLLLAVDVHRWRSTMAADDVAFRTQPSRLDLWSPPQLVPGVARDLLGVGDDVLARRAYQLFKLGRPRVLFFLAGPQVISFRSAAQAELAQAVDSDRVPARRSQELNMLGVLELIAVGAGDPGQRQRHLPRAADDFRGALALDPANPDAKFNLELTLRLLQNQQGSGESQGGFGGASARGDQSGTGY